MANAYNFAFLDEGSKREIRRAILKAVAIPGYQVPFASRVKAETGMPTFAVGLIRDAWQAETLLREGAADVIDIGRAMLDDPHWGWHAASALHVKEVPELVVPPQYLRGLTY